MAGNERLAYEIAAIYSGSPEIKKAFDDFAKLNAQGQKVVNQLDRMGQQAKKTGEEIRNSRAGAAQLGMQFNQLGTQVVSGTSVFTAFAQQIGDVGYAMTMMGGRTAAVGNFLAGPWGAAIGIAAVALGPLISGLSNAEVKTQKLTDSSKEYTEVSTQQRLANASLIEITDKLNSLSGRYTETLQEQANAAVTVAKAKLQEAEASLATAKALAEENKQKARNFHITSQMLAQGRGEPGATAAIGAAAAMSASFEYAARDAETDFKRLEGLVNKARSSLNYLITNGVKLNQRSSESARSARNMANANRQEANTIEEIDRKYQSLLDKKMKAFREEGKPIFVTNLPTTLDQTIVQPSIDVLNQVSEYINSTYGQQVAMAIKGPNEEMIKSFESIGASVDNAFKGMLTAGMSWKDGMKGIINSVINELWRLYVTQQIVGMISNAIGGLFGGGGIGGSTGGLEANFDKVFSGRAIGGSVSANTPYVVGERGPELFVPGGNGTIIPNKNMGNGGGAPNINVTVDARGSADPAAVREQVQRGILEAAPAIVAAAQQRTINTLRRPKLGGVMQ